VEARVELGELRYALGEVKEAIAQYEEAVRRQPGVKVLESLAAAQAAAGRFSDAVAAAERAVAMAREAGQVEAAERIQKRLEQYKAGQSLRMGTPAAP
jgi:tetratricopeptide (TPR) repeat protein